MTDAQDKAFQNRPRYEYPVVPGIAHMHIQSEHGPQLEPGTCLGSLAHFMLGHPSGAPTASIGWDRSGGKHRYEGGSLDVFLRSIPRGFPVWFSGGTPTVNHPEGDGHVLCSGVPFIGWSLDRKRSGFYDRVTIQSILTWNPSHPHKLLGWSKDIAGFALPYEPHSKDARRV